jgi:glycosyltransferase involved in cell wall biosynthesis
MAFGNGTPARALIVGSALFGEDAYESRLKYLITELGLDDRVTMLGFSDEIPTILRQVDCLVHASVLPEPFGQVVAEGMAAGLPVIASNAGGPRELISDGITGLLHTPGDVEELAAALRRLQADPVLAAQLGRAGKQVVSELTPDAVAGRMMNVYESLRSRRRIASKASVTDWP